jgi:hypothetical protein
MLIIKPFKKCFLKTLRKVLKNPELNADFKSGEIVAQNVYPTKVITQPL